MKLTPMNLYNVNNKNHFKNQSIVTENKENITDKNYEYNPIAYRDYNISFGARLFRTPENFYAQSFNQYGMPATMKEYLYDDFEDRQKMPPAQMFKLVYEDIKFADSLEEVKIAFPEESLFEDLSDTPNRKSRTGVIAEVELMAQDGKALFKDSDDSLPLYLLKKIYTEGKTLKEINTDFQKDISEEFKGISPIDYTTLSAYGIKYPNNAFWKSFTATREEFPYTYTPRKAVESRNIGVGTGTRTTSTQTDAEKKPTKPNKFKDVKDWEIDKLTDIMVKSHGQSETSKRLKKTNLQNKESLNFVAQYMSEIMSVVLEKLHVSEEMKDFYMDYDNLSKSQKEKFAAYWQNDWLKEQQSKVMQGTIRLFFDTYGVDGNNEDFQELLEYARNIKPNRIARQEEHDRLQEEYERELAIYPESEVNDEKQITEEQDTLAELKATKSYEELVDKLTEKYGAETYRFKINGEDTDIVVNIDEARNEALESQTRFLPTTLAKKYMDFVLHHPLGIGKRYKLTTILKDKGLEIPDDKRVLSEEVFNRRTALINKDFSEKYPQECNAAHQALADLMIKSTGNDLPAKVFIIPIFEFLEMPRGHKDLIFDKIDFMNAQFNKYKQPLTTSEKHKVLNIVLDMLRKYDPKTSLLPENQSYDGLQHIFKCLSIVLNSKSASSIAVKAFLTEHVANFGGSLRYLLDKNVPQNYKDAKLEEFLCAFNGHQLNMINGFIWTEPEAVSYLKHNYIEMYLFLKNHAFGDIMPER